MQLLQQNFTGQKFNANFNWLTELKRNITSVEELQKFIPLDPVDANNINRVTKLHPMNITRYYLSLVDSKNPNDPIRKMAIPTEEELIEAGVMGATTADPYGDDKHDKGNGILHKYPYSALILATEYCAMYCRHCFRKRMVGLPNEQTVENFKKAVEYISEHEEITNVIISGGDPLLYETHLLEKMLTPLLDIPHLNYVRIGSRAPVVFPQRFFEKDIIDFFAEFNKQKALYIPTHFNHANEITNTATEAVKRIRSAGVTMNNQAVFLRGVNDTVEDLENLMNCLVRIGINPYYLYQCMPVKRVRSHFQIPLKEGIDTVTDTKKRLDGYAKRFRFIMGHDSGKIEICGRKENKLIMNRIHARPDSKQGESTIIIRTLNDKGGWLEDLPEINTEQKEEIK